MNRHKCKSGVSTGEDRYTRSQSISSVTKHNGGWDWGGVRICTGQHKGVRSNVTSIMRDRVVKFPEKSVTLQLNGPL